jgi:thiamine-phosphate pyrophosphorylase
MSQTPILRILDASLNRASEGLRVVEDYVRFVLDDPFLTGRAKSLRHDLATASAAISMLDRHAARDTQRDVGTAISTEAEVSRRDAWEVCAASLKRSEQSLRSLEEYGKVLDDEFAGQMESLRYALYSLEKAIDVGRSSRDRLLEVHLCVLVSGRDSSARFEQIIGELIDAGVGMIQLRDKNLDDRDLVLRARSLVERTRGSKTLCIINDRADIAAAVGADGVHVGQEDLSVKDARTIVGTPMLIGVSTHNIEQARAAVMDGANYLGAGPTFTSQTKRFDDFAGLAYLREVSSEIRLPTFAIGGITADNLPSVMTAGIERVAVGAAVVDAADPTCAVRELLSTLSGTYDRSRPAAEAASTSQSPVPSP